ncbi:hypothetical protein BXZ70DRAFT_935741 [Cristinia sonorae]|uniref:BTB domain-containing protein n=1 Tax=Cristinia sonorae TaxID=1940300 RepID=A0A8K0XQ49_9AGAR|nr:hypothetical protein BXZ70DRAFT_935741 [Cristinia sonorae]
MTQNDSLVPGSPSWSDASLDDPSLCSEASFSYQVSTVGDDDARQHDIVDSLKNNTPDWKDISMPDWKDTGMPSPEPEKLPLFQDCTDFWYEDGGVVIVAESTAFRVHPTILSRQSPVIAGMLSPLRTSANASQTMYKGCPVVHFLDTACGVRYFMQWIYDTGFHVNHTLELNVLSEMLRISTKYEISNLRQSVLDALRHYFPSSLEAFHTAKTTHHSHLTTGDYFLLANTCRETGVTSILPMILLICAHQDLTAILDGVPYPHTPSGHIELSPKNKRIILGARPQLTHIARTVTLGVLYSARGHCAAAWFWKPFRMVICGDKKRWAGWQMITECRKDGFNSPMPETFGPFDTFEFCRHCQREYDAGVAQGRRETWDGLPEIFGLENWDAVNSGDD